MLQVTEVQDFELSRFESNRTVSVFRTPSRIWAYAMPRDDGAYGVAVFVQFRVTGQQAAGGGGGARLPFEPEMVTVEGGKFQMGCTAEQSDCDNDEKNVHWVQLKSFSIGKTEVTNEQFVAFLNDISSEISIDATGTTVSIYNVELINLSDQIKYSNAVWAGGTFSVAPGLEKHPVVYVSWFAAQEYLKWISVKTGKKYRLPTEAEWEYAARGGNKSKGYKYAGSNNLDEVGWYTVNAGGKPQSVGQKKVNELGLYDMSGNVYEWCSDWYADSYSSAPQIDPGGPVSGEFHGCRGGSWGSHSRFCRVTNRNVNSTGNDLGFRVARDN
ncbi:MAG: formylglycine-generating enzyme family protein [Lewinellaceae bacterium]|nr:formylglycine-generating enzyme family protein [Lewinellaceae bacterium]